MTFRSWIASPSTRRPMPATRIASKTALTAGGRIHSRRDSRKWDRPLACPPQIYMKLSTLILLALPLAAESLADHANRLPTDERISMYQALVEAKPENFHYQNQLAAGYVQKMRETMDPNY